MKRAPIIPKMVKNNTAETEVDAPTAPMVDTLISRVGAMAKGNAVTLPVCGRDVRFTLEIVAAGQVQKSTSVWTGNERDQGLLTTENALDDLIPSFVISGQQNPAYGRKVSGSIEIADGSRRRMTAIVTSREYRVLVGDLDDEQMNSLCKIGNDYRPTSAYERGKRYCHRLEQEFSGNISSLSDAENISRKIITRCINTASLPRQVIALFSQPGELSARAGDSLAKVFKSHEAIILRQTELMAKRKAAGEKLEADKIIKQFNDAIDGPQRTSSAKRQYATGATSQYKGEKFLISLDTALISPDVIEKIEAILTSLKDSSGH
ncbi:plasmid-partitioning protein [Rahnella sp. AA]|uniref:ParB/RepB/Spo0J family plasmid partition protein n=1 Tax=Rahnella sp. AA TaxID=2057180 RepID=UPI000C31C9F0|nr:ParB/RepB/Spo0J family plasmid partition protein [Rahnella sp. AA]PKE27452.1 plasmid-partitioning protein [Rahnella sp. AA]